MAAPDYHRSTSFPPRPYRRYEDEPTLPHLPSIYSQDEPTLPRLPSSYSLREPTLPRLPSTNSQTTYDSYSHLSPVPSYHSFSRYSEPHEYSDTIPLTGRKKSETQHTIVPVQPEQELQDDLFIRDVDPSKRRRRRNAPPPPKDGWFTGKITWVVFVLTVIQLIVFLAEIIRNGILTASPIEIHPSFNPMIGPSPYVMINMGARYQPCMHNMPNVQNASTTISWPCPNATAVTGSSVTCSLSELCGFDGVPNPHPNGSIHEKPAPNQWWRFITPIFIHAGIIHIGFNLLLQLTLGRDIEKLIGSIRFAIVYFASGIFGFVLGGNFAANGIASCGCSGSLFGILAITLLDLLYTWKRRTGPIKDLLFILIDVIVAFVLGLLPGLDNFSHIGGFLMGLVLGICLLRSPTSISKRTSPSPLSRPHEEGFRGFCSQPLTFFRHRKGVWWAWWLLRVVTLVGALIGFVLLIKNFYFWGVTCHWCKYLSCLPVTVNGENWCNVGNLDFTPTNETTSGKPLARGLTDTAYMAALEAMNSVI